MKLKTSNSKTMNTKFTMTFRDMENFIRYYDEDDKYLIERWIMDLE